MEQITTAPPLTFEQAMALLDKRHLDTLAKIEADKIATFAKIEADKKIHEEQMKKRDEELQEFKERMDRLSNRFGDLGNRLGDIVEYLVTSNLKEKFDKYGFYFRNTALKVQVSAGRRTITDIDVLLCDGDTIMAVEVKTKPNLDDVERHIERMDEILQYPNNFTRGMKIYGAIAGAIVDDEVKEKAFKSGFFVITQVDDNVNIITPPENFVPKCWTDITK